MDHRFTRRDFVRSSATLTTALAVGSQRGAIAGDSRNDDFASQWQATPDRVWIGQDYWANPMQDWRIANGRLECIKAAADRNVHLLTRQLGAQQGDLRMSVRVGRMDGKPLADGPGSVGFRVGVRGPLDDYRNSLIFGSGLDAGISPTRPALRGLAGRRNGTDHCR